MSADTCAVLTAVFPLVLLAILTERRSLTMKVRRARWFRLAAIWGSFASVLALPVVVAGVQLEGLTWTFGMLTWFAFGVALLSLLLLVFVHLASAELEEDD